MEADFSGYATKAGLKCSDGRTIMPDAFKHQDTMRVPLVWQHGHNDPENVLGHALLENRIDGVYCYGFLNDSPKAVHTRGLIEHKDITMLSIWANDLIERAGRVLHGAIREVSLVLSGANPGALIENVTIRHSDDEVMTLDDEVIIYTGLSFEHAVGGAGNLAPAAKDTSSADTGGDGETLQDVVDSMNQKQQDVMHYLIGEALASSGNSAAQSAIDTDKKDTDPDNEDDEKDKDAAFLANSNLDKDDKNDNTNVDDSKGKGMGKGIRHNVFEKKEGVEEVILSHADIKGIMADATRRGSLKDAIEGYALSHGIEDIDILFPDAVAVDNVPEFLQRRVEWVGSFLGAVRKSPFSRIKTFAADITLDEARAKGYVTGALKREEFFSVTRRVTTPVTVYKKQALDRDDIVDITDFDVVAWLKGEMRLMLDEEIARAALIGDGRDVSSEDKIPETNIRPIATDHELFVTTVTVNIGDANSSVSEIIDGIIANRKYYKGTGQPNMYTSETIISMFLLLRDSLGRRIYKTVEEVAAELRVASIVPVEVMEDEADLIAVIVNPVDYVMGATRGGEVSMFDDFDIDYNKNKYLIETRLSGALTRLKSALVIRKSASDHVAVTPNDPTFVSSTGVVTIVATTGVTYKNADTDATLQTGAQTAIDPGATINIRAEANDGYFIPSTADAYWSFTHTT